MTSLNPEQYHGEYGGSTPWSQQVDKIDCHLCQGTGFWRGQKCRHVDFAAVAVRGSAKVRAVLAEKTRQRPPPAPSLHEALASQQRAASPPTPLPAEPVGTEDTGARK